MADCLPSRTAPHLNFSLTYVNSVEIHLETWMICRLAYRTQSTETVLISCCCSNEDGLEMYKILKHTYLAIVLLIWSFVSPRLPFHRRLGLLKVRTHWASH